VEDDEALREALAEVLAASPRWRLTASWPAAEPALDGMREGCPAVVLMDIQLPGMSGIACAALLKERHPAAQIMTLTVYDNNDRIFDALAAGASGYLLKRDASPKLLEALDDLVAGGSPMSSAIARKVVQHFHREAPVKNEDLNLTPREKQILELLVK